MEDGRTNRFVITLDFGHLEFEIKGKSNPTWTHITKWDCEVVPATFNLRIHKELLRASRRLRETFNDCLDETLTRIWNRKQFFIFEFEHDTPDKAFQMATKFVDVKATIVKFIQENDANVTDISLNGSQPYNKNTGTPTPADSHLHVASRAGDLEAVRQILATGQVDVNCRNRSGATSVMEAAYKGHREVVELLVSEGADVSPVNDNGYNTLHFACEGGDVETVEFVLSQKGSDVNARNIIGKTAADLARDNGHEKVVDLLLPVAVT